MISRLICLDFEMTGHSEGPQIIEIGAVEIVNGQKSGRTFHAYVNPKSPVNPIARGIHGLTNDFLEQHPDFSLVAPEFLRFIEGTPLVMHSAESDMHALMHDFTHYHISFTLTNQIFCTHEASKRWPDCSFYPQGTGLSGISSYLGVDNYLKDRVEVHGVMKRRKHSALLDANLLASCVEHIIDRNLPAFQNDHPLEIAYQNRFQADRLARKDARIERREKKAETAPVRFHAALKGDLIIFTSPTGNQLAVPLPPLPETHWVRIGTDQKMVIICQNHDPKSPDGIGRNPHNPKGLNAFYATHKGIYAIHHNNPNPVRYRPQAV